MTDVVIAPRFNGPPTSANGGYTAGLVARLLGAETAEVRLRVPPPLGRPLRWDGRRLLDGEQVVAEGSSLSPAEKPEAIAPVTLAEAVDASPRYQGFAEHAFPTCFGCGPERAEGDGLRIFAGAVAGRPDDVAAPWTPHESLLVDGAIPVEVAWAALDCSGGWAGLAAATGAPHVLGTMVATLDSTPRACDTDVAMGWRIDTDGRKLHCGSALFTPAGELIARSRQTWIRLSA
jgi:hypothetical protein